ALARLISPIGIAGVTGKEPDVIAIAALAQLLQLRETA
ncbi:MAG: xanthine dehydrogenase accessory protein XdhC, partial [Sphingomonas sp.]